MKKKLEQPTEFIIVTQSDRKKSGSVSPFSISSSQRDDNVVPKMNFRLVENVNAVETIAASYPREQVLGVFPNHNYYPAILTIPRPLRPKTGFSPSAFKKPAKTITVEVVGKGGQGLANVEVIANISSTTGDYGLTAANGTISLALNSTVLKELIVLPAEGYWPRELRNVTVTEGRIVVSLTPIDLAVPSILQHFMAHSAQSANGRDVKIAVLDSGIDPHQDLKHALIGGKCFTGEASNPHYDNGINHGTHVAGIIASKFVGIAPEAQILSYRIFSKNSDHTSTLSIVEALEEAIKDKVDIINMSIGSELPDTLLEMMVKRAEKEGIVVIAAAGNESGPVNSPAAYECVVGVAAAGNAVCFPVDSKQLLTGNHQIGNNGDYIADFSCFGVEINCAGPGVGVASTVRQSSYQVFDGTSMACPAVTGIAARLLSDNLDIKNATRDAARSQNLKKLLYSSCNTLNLQQIYQGQGVPQ